MVERKYETVFIISPTLDDEARANLIEKFKNLISSNGQLLNVEEWGKRRLAYKIDKHAEGYYVLMQFTSKPEFPRELERVYRITDGVIRFLIVKLEK
ncbi:small subunit ribosomal protein S6 [Caldicellulosiruptor bescii]|uniref:Small ribosomal subunit protein bS6 n=2 Tax=Caldicellulosiruptor bescii TaxID=31899 RepID=B9MLV1_CALBD|nr:30S ribosomal protein S6 [Caldicellulosiruptor bescii]ACM61174.1 ribosomal protein S6 [Caldicellulosiruptor bescii DSM 6725]PBC89013.1 small subunit ribosomal protein S6 [Caldicellulosiruptor bescii]PBC91505.1 small subunit ribosomal protein S6 [Caldicellulosiruptor bescii]PBD03083.1 small subunit ribosomal protein S6 [Caldicellulosiruptor bescii]PBD07303.1 small subunit ribosomal protein S6 [Caldicellulosiruptor bescii]